jgi:hypothetical protein
VSTWNFNGHCLIVTGGLIPLHNACSFGHADVVQLLLSHGADANTRDNWNFTPLHEAAIKGKIDVCIGKHMTLIVLLYEVRSKYLTVHLYKLAEL